MRGFFIAPQRNKYYRCLCGLIACILSFSLVFSPTAGYAQSIHSLNLPIPGTMVGPSSVFAPVLLKGMTIYPEDPLKFDFIIDIGNSGLNVGARHAVLLREETEKLIKYFLASMTVPKDDLWVNLSPYENDRIIPEELGKTELGRDMLAQDYILKQLTASLMYPEEELGKKFWDRIYERAEKKFGTSEVPVNTFNKVWILPESATVYEHGKTVYIVDAHLKVMLDEDYRAMEHNSVGARHAAPVQDELSVSSQIIKEIILPEIEREVNEGTHFAPLRQIYHSLILAKWYKETIKNSVGARHAVPLLEQIYIDQNKIAGVDVDDATIKDQIYAQYMEAYKKGVFNYIKEDYVAMDFQQKSTATPYAPAEGDDIVQKIIPRKYFSGGLKIGAGNIKRTSSPVNESKNPKFQVSVEVSPQKVSTSSPIDFWSKKKYEKMLNHSVSSKRLAAIKRIREKDKREFKPQLFEKLGDEDKEVRKEAKRTLYAFRTPDLDMVLAYNKALLSKSDKAVEEAIGELRSIRNSAAIESLKGVMENHSNIQLRKKSVEAIIDIGGTDATTIRLVRDRLVEEISWFKGLKKTLDYHVYSNIPIAIVFLKKDYDFKILYQKEDGYYVHHEQSPIVLTDDEAGIMNAQYGTGQYPYGGGDIIGYTPAYDEWVVSIPEEIKIVRDKESDQSGSLFLPRTSSPAEHTSVTEARQNLVSAMEKLYDEISNVGKKISKYEEGIYDISEGELYNTFVYGFGNIHETLQLNIKHLRKGGTEVLDDMGSEVIMGCLRTVKERIRKQNYLTDHSEIVDQFNQIIDNSQIAALVKELQNHLDTHGAVFDDTVTITEKRTGAEILSEHLQSIAAIADSKIVDADSMRRLKETVDAVHAEIGKDDRLKDGFMKLISQKEVTAREILDFLKRITLLGVIGHGKTWNFASKGKAGDGSWWKMIIEQPEFDLKVPIDRLQHIEAMVKAADDFLHGRFEELETGFYKAVTGRDDIRTQPGALYPQQGGKKLSSGKLAELYSAFDGTRGFTEEQLFMLKISVVLHDYGRLMEGKGFKLDSDGRIISDEKASTQHRDSGAVLARELLASMGFDDQNAVRIIEFLIRRHDAVWSLYAGQTYGQEWSGGYRGQESLAEEIIELSAKVDSAVAPQDVIHMLAVISVADVHASGDRYLSDQFIDFTLGLIDFVKDKKRNQSLVPSGENDLSSSPVGTLDETRIDRLVVRLLDEDAAVRNEAVKTLKELSDGQMVGLLRRIKRYPQTFGVLGKMFGKSGEISVESLKNSGLDLPGIFQEDWFNGKGHPSDLFHDFLHSQDVAAITYILAKAMGWDDDQASFLYLVGLLHDFDPDRVPNTPSRVPATLQHITDDFYKIKSLDGKKGRSMLKEYLGWGEREYLMAMAIIQRTEFPFNEEHLNPAYKEISPVARYGHISDKLNEIDPEAVRFVVEQAPMISEYADKANRFFIGGFSYGVDRLEAFIKEINGSSDNHASVLKTFLIDDQYAFTSSLGSSENFTFDKAMAVRFGFENTIFLSLSQALKKMPASFALRFQANARAFKTLNETYDPAQDNFAQAAVFALSDFISVMESGNSDAAGQETILPVSILEETGIEGMDAAEINALRKEISMRRLILLGNPLSGKSTHGKTLARILQIPYIRASALLYQVRSSPEEAQKYGISEDQRQEILKMMLEGRMVPHTVTDRIIEKRLSQPDAANGFIIDGYPRQVESAGALDRFLDGQGLEIDGIIVIDISEDEVWYRSDVRQREDDVNKDAVQARLNVFNEKTTEILASRQDLVINVSGSREALVTRDALLEGLKVKSNSPVGGIDFNKIDVDRQGAGVDIRFDPVEVQDIIDMGVDGFAPVIIHITPLPSILPLLGLEPRKDEELEISRK